MKKFISNLLIGIITFVSIFILLNINVSTRQGINYQWHTRKMPLYLKILGFFDRHYNYQQLVKDIVGDIKVDRGRVMEIFKWTHNNIRKVPSGFPVVDDHTWHIIVRGYGTDDQVQDVFTTLCSYAGIDAFFNWVYSRDKSERISLSFVKIGDKWNVFDSYRGIYFKTKDGNIASIEEIKNKNWIPENILNKELDFDYKEYFDNLPNIKDIGLVRANTQSPLRRIIFEVRKWSNLK